jgi:hypothetical protein
MRLYEITKTLNPPSISIGDEVKVGKFKNRKAEVKGFTKDDHGQPVLKTTKGDQKLYKPRVSKLEPKEVDEGVDDSWNNNGETITLQDILQLTNSIPVKQYATKKLASIVLDWDNNPDEIDKIEQSNLDYPILIMVDDNEKIKWILDGNHRAQKAIKNSLPTISAKLIKLADLDDKARRILG